MDAHASAIRSIVLDGLAGRLEALLNVGAPEAAYAALVCHPHPLYGGTLHNKVVFHAMKALNSFGFPVLRFNFRGTGLSQGEHDHGAGETDDVRTALDWLDREFHLPLIFAGFSFGKAAHTMLVALHEAAGTRFEGIVASSVAPEFQIRGFRYFHGGHPLPNTESIRAADAMLKSLAAQNESSLVIYLVSGGGSAAAEKPIDEEISLDDLIETYRALVHSGAPIAEINAIRKHLSAIKGGHLAQAGYPAQ